MEYNIYQEVLENIERSMQLLHERKQNDGLDGEEKRNISVAYTDLEKAGAYIKVYLVNKECES